jgi:predicted nucleotidyltransferase
MHEREREISHLSQAIAEWARSREDVRAVALVGSWARGRPRHDSDLDLVLLTTSPLRYIQTDKWAHDVGADAIVATRSWGVVTERRLRMPTGLEVEVGVAGPAWAWIEPIDPGTAAVTAGGLVALYDPVGILERLIDAVSHG